MRLAALPSPAVAPAVASLLAPLLAPALALGLGGCPAPGGGGPTDGRCFMDDECGSGDVCARDNLCWSASDVRFVKATWTMRGQPADATTCAQFPDLYIEFRGPRVENLAFSPVPCANGQFVVDKLPFEFTRVEVGAQSSSGPWDVTSIGSTGAAALDLTF